VVVGVVLVAGGAVTGGVAGAIVEAGGTAAGVVGAGVDSVVVVVFPLVSAGVWGSLQPARVNIAIAAKGRMIFAFIFNVLSGVREDHHFVTERSGEVWASSGFFRGTPGNGRL
jgi:hypothetical protein